MAVPGYNVPAITPVKLDIPRSRFRLPDGQQTCMDAGRLYPIYYREVLPGDTFDLTTACTCRMTTPIAPVMDNAWMDIQFYYVPDRLVWTHFKAMMGENELGPWYNSEVEYEVPQLIVDADHVPSQGSVWDHFALPMVKAPALRDGSFSVSALPFRAYALIWNEWFRAEATQDYTYINLGDSDQYVKPMIDEDDNPDYYINNSGFYGANPLPVSKFHDVFTSALPSPQKGPAVGVSASGDIPVVAGASHDVGSSEGLRFYSSYTGVADTFIESMGVQWSEATSEWSAGPYNGVGTSTPIPPLYPANLHGLPEDLFIGVSDLRAAFQVQKLLEADARGGTRYRELLKAHFGVTAPDATLQIPEYLAGDRIAINMSQVIQTSATGQSGAETPQGNVAGHSLTNSKSAHFVKSFSEHGMIIGVACIRTAHSYSQGIPREWSHKKRLDFYWPELANISEQAILNKELFALGDDYKDPVSGEVIDNMAFGFQEAWYEYRYGRRSVTDLMRPDATGSLSIWNYSDDFEGLPILNSDFIFETKKNVARTLAVENQPQFICDFYFDCIATRPMPLYSIPGLIDHH